MLYFDHNATSPLCNAARQAWLEATERYIGNPSSQHRLGTRADRALDNAREELAGLIGCNPSEVIWTSGATEGNNAVLRHCASERGEAWISAIEHPSVVEAARHWFEDRVRLIPVSNSGVVDLPWLREELRRNRPAVVAVMAANNETGVLQPWRAVMSLCDEAGVPYLCDGAQWVGKLPGDGLGLCGFLTACSHKFGGPAGVGFIRARKRMRPLLIGGPQEDGQRAGTENVAGVIAMVAALRARQAAMETGITQRVRWRQEFIETLEGSLPDATILGRASESLWNTVSAMMPDVDCRARWVVKLDKLGVAVSTGAACSSGTEKPSHVLLAMGCSEEQARRVLRFSSGWETTEADWQHLSVKVREAATELQGTAGVPAVLSVGPVARSSVS